MTCGSKAPAALLLVLGFAVAADAKAQDALTLQGRIFDFPSSHPDFEADGGGLAPGRVADRLGEDGRPVWSGASLSGFSTPEAFAQWYRDVPGVNASTPFEITLEPVEGGAFYAYDSTAFFPIDGRLLGDEGGQWRDASGTPRNFHFTTHLAGDFTYASPDDAFTFTGDDDLWVFFDGHLGVDLGGMHGPETATITGERLAALGLAAGETHRIDIFHAERHTDGSNFRIETNFLIEAPADPELPADGIAPGVPSRIDTLATATCGSHVLDAAEALAGEEDPTVRFLALVCADTTDGVLAFSAASNRREAAAQAAFNGCLEATSSLEEAALVTPCALVGEAERVPALVPDAVLSPGQILAAGREYRSPDGPYTLTWTGGTDLEVRDAVTGQRTWLLSLVATAVERVEMRPSGTLAITATDGSVAWETPIEAPVEGSAFFINARGVPVVRAPDGTVLWRGDRAEDWPAREVPRLVAFDVTWSETRPGVAGGEIIVETTTSVIQTVSVTPPADVAGPNAGLVIPASEMTPMDEVIGCACEPGTAGASAFALPDGAAEDASAASAPTSGPAAGEGSLDAQAQAMPATPGAAAPEPDPDEGLGQASGEVMAEGSAQDPAAPELAAPAAVLAELPDRGVLLTYSINDQARSSDAPGPDDFYVAIGVGDGIIAQGTGQAFLIQRNGDSLALQVDGGEFAGMFLTADASGVYLSDALVPEAIFVLRPPLEPASGNFASLESAAFPGLFLRHQNYVLRLDEATAASPSLLRRDATFRIERASTAEAGVAPAPGPGICAEALQGRIAWDQAGSTGWADANLAALCGSVDTAEPAACFEQVMHGGVEWAPGEATWGWENALALCAGTTDAAARVGCFSAAMPELGWEAAIADCRARTPGEAP